jgi:GTP-binding protein Era
MEKDKRFKSGFVSVVGRPNAGKSTLINRYVGEKVSIVSPKPQTTRNRISGIVTTADYQIVFEDTPGAVEKKGKLSDFMQKSIEAAGGGCDITLLLIDGNRGVTEADNRLAEKYLAGGKPVVIAVNKTDEAPADKVFPILKHFSDKGFGDVYPISARTGGNTDVLLRRILELLGEGEQYFPEGAVTDRSGRFMAAEVVREQALYAYRNEIPHGIGVSILEYGFDEEKDLLSVAAVLY